MTLKICNWNVGGAKLMRLQAAERADYHRALNDSIADLCRDERPDVMCLQEVIESIGERGGRQHLIEAPPGYHYRMISVLDSERQTHPVRWNRYREMAGWQSDDFIGQGLGFLWRQDLRHASIWDFRGGLAGSDLSVEVVPIETGLFVGDRDTEPRAAALAHFVVEPFESAGERIDLMVVNLHLSTLHGEREDNPDRDGMGAQTRRDQLRIVLDGVVARHSGWVHLLPDEVAPERAAVWVLSGDFNAFPDSAEVADLINDGFRDASPNKGTGNKTRGLGNPPAHTVDYVFANYLERWPEFGEIFVRTAGTSPEPLLAYRTSDHYPVIANVPLQAPTDEGA